ncbi:heme peroxidase [Jimgerdemannia flammicorona]|uniref:Heme peroxidase n=1 Tax=Jimgerdemannia flammicorona TaxID=994334 RepID=A0A433DKN9_9FUNG|nr:heme peroxidase [Jimgerdemannia flammicorona]
MRAVTFVTALSLTGASFVSAQATIPRPINNLGNNPTDVYAGTPNQTLLRLNVPTPNFANASGALFPGSLPPATVATNTTTYPAFQCLVAPPAPPAQPYPRCVSDLVSGYTNSPLGLQVEDARVRSVRKVSHLESFWAQLLSYDLLDIEMGTTELVNIGIPTDDVILNTGSSGVSTAAITNSTSNSLEFYRASNVVDPDTQQTNHTGINLATGFLDASPIYGSNDAVLQTLRDVPGTHGKMTLLAQNLTSYGEPGPLPPLDSNGRFRLGSNPPRSANIFSVTLTTILLREHNRQCDRLYHLHNTTWTDDQYFQEARKWVIAFVQKITATEYLGVLLGRPLLPYTGYRPDVKPGIDTFFAMASFRYGHSVLSDEYRMVGTDAQLTGSFNLKGMLNSSYLIRNKYDIATIMRSLSLQVQEEVDVYYADSVRNYVNVFNTTVDIASSDNLRARDQGLPLYNDARQAFGLPRKISFADITNDINVQKRLAQTYQSVDQVESLVGGLAEDHVAGASVGELFNASLWNQFTRLRDSDRFWYENDMFTAEELDVISHTSLRDIIIRNLADPATGNLQTVSATQTYTASLNDTSQPNPLSSLLPDNLWFVQPIVSQSRETLRNAPSNSLVDSTAYPYYCQFTSQYMIQWNTDQSANRINIALTLYSSQGWFGIGLNPSGALSMAGADFIIVSASSINDVKLDLYRSQGNAQAPVKDTDAYALSNVNKTIVGGAAVLVKFTRALDTGVAGKAVFSDSDMNVIWAYNPYDPNPTYHGGNRGGMQVNFLSGMIAEVNAESKRTTQLVHGVLMFTVWALLFPVSIYIMR